MNENVINTEAQKLKAGDIVQGEVQDWYGNPQKVFFKITRVKAMTFFKKAHAYGGWFDAGGDEMRAYQATPLKGEQWGIYFKTGKCSKGVARKI